MSNRSETLAIAAIDREQELKQVVGAHRNEIDFLQKLFKLIEQCRYFQHGSDIDAFGQRVSVLTQISQFALDDALGGVEFGHFRDHREHDAQASPAAGAQQRADLAAQQAWPVEPEPDRAPAERRIFLDHALHIGQRLVAADVEGAERHRL